FVTRFDLPLLPPLAIALAAAVQPLARRRGAPLLVAALVLPVALPTVRLVHLLLSRDTRAELHDWLEGEL
ncbi:MAG: hypothetical protein AAFR88_13350, partial [Pseudomonadota bacterium]